MPIGQPKKPPRPKPVLGWREWISLPDLGIDAIKAKVDTGARSSSLHAEEIREFTRDDSAFVEFHAWPAGETVDAGTYCVAPLLEYRTVRSSNGVEERRPVIRTRFEIAGRTWTIDLTLTSRAEMGFQMLLGREAIRKRFFVDAGRSFLMGRPEDVPAPSTGRHS